MAAWFAMYALDFDLEAVLPFAQDRIQGLLRTQNMTAIGLRKRGELTACVVYEGFNGRNMWIHMAAEAGWVTRDFLKACFHYPFNVCGVERLSGQVMESNHRSRRVTEHLGFKEEARLKGASADGSDLIVYVMWKQECRYVA
jgi:RimJ/RimL family protein N-acetyltransferase